MSLPIKMADGMQFIPLVGKASDSPEIKAWLQQLETKPPKLKRGDVNCHCCVYKEGLELAFIDEADLTMNPDLAIGEGGLFLSSIRFTSSKIPDYTQYAGKLPFGITFEQTQADVHALFGPPPKKHPFLPRERRAMDGVDFIIGYDKSYQFIKECSLALPRPAEAPK